MSIESTIPPPAPPSADGGSAWSVALYVLAASITGAGVLASLFLCFVLLMCTGTPNPAGKMLAVVGLLLAALAGCACVIASIAAMFARRPEWACFIGAVPFALVIGFFVLTSLFK